MHTRMYRGYQFAWGDPKDPLLTNIGTPDGDYITDAEDPDEAERLVDQWVDEAR